MNLESTYQQLLDAIGPQGLFAVLGSIAVMRVIRARFYMTKTQAFIAAPVVSALIGAGCMYFMTDNPTTKSILGGAFVTIIATMLAYDLIKIALTVLYAKTKWDVFRFIFFFVSPKPVKIEKDNKVIEVPASATLTQFMDFRDQTRVMTEDEKKERGLKDE